MPVLSRSFTGDRERESRDPLPVLPTGSSRHRNRSGSTHLRLRKARSAPSQTPSHPTFTAVSPITSTLRANPYPEVTDPICRFPLPTFFHRLEAVHLGDLMRISVRSSASVQNALPSHRIFKGQPETTTDGTQTSRSSGWPLTAVSVTLSPRDGIPGSRSLKQKR